MIYASFVLALLVLLVGQSATPAAPASEEFNGPFSSWTQVQCTGQDDTAQLQNALNGLGHAGSYVVYIQPGVCRITATLTLSRVQYVTLLGHDPSDTRIVYAGPAGTPMFTLNGVGHSRFGRLTWDGGGLASSVYFDAWVGPDPYFPTALRHEDEVFQNLRPDGVIAYLGAAGGGTAETTWIRDRFTGPSDAAMFLANYNVLDQWVWDSVFDSNTRGITNYLGSRANGAGAFAANRSVFLNSSEADLETGNVAGPYADRWNYSRGSAVHVLGQAIGSPAPGWTAQGDVILDTPVNPISLGSAGPLGLVDNTFRGGKPQGMLGVQEGYASSPTGELWGIGNTFSNASPLQYAIPLPRGRIHAQIDDVLNATISDPGYTVAATPPAVSRPVLEPQSTDGSAVQRAIDAAAACGQPRCVVHLPAGTYQVSQTLVVPAGSDMQIVGDGPGATILQGSGTTTGPILELDGPSRATVRDVYISGQGAPEGLAVRSADQSGGLIHAEDVIATGKVVGLQVDGISQTTVDFLDLQAGGESATPGSTAIQLLNGAHASIFNGALGADTLYDVRDQSQLVAETMYEEGVSMRPVNVLAPNGSGTLVLDSSKLQSYLPGMFDASSFTGPVTIDNTHATRIVFRGGADFLGLGVVSDVGLLMDFAQPFAWWEPRRIDGSGSAPVDEQAAGVSDQAQYLRDHFAPLRATKPRALVPAPPNATDVRMYRVFVDTAETAVNLQANP
ncbi:MAG: hypothetical protein JO020_02065 [Chloroflexi bacterium]|nr:hypothetical protein [Chloroflexota bacterium]MBV9892934.1 hypothetical protein [Chloroflexota bacterium]